MAGLFYCRSHRSDISRSITARRLRQRQKHIPLYIDTGQIQIIMVEYHYNYNNYGAYQDTVRTAKATMAGVGANPTDSYSNLQAVIQTILAYLSTAIQYIRHLYIKLDTTYPIVVPFVTNIILVYIAYKVLFYVLKSVISTLVTVAKLAVIALIIFEIGKVYYGEDKMKLVLDDLQRFRLLLFMVYNLVRRLVTMVMNGDWTDLESRFGAQVESQFGDGAGTNEDRDFWSGYLRG